MNFGEALYRHLSQADDDDLVDDDEYDEDDIHDMLTDLALTSGSVSALARNLGVARSTLRGWLGGRQPSRRHAEALSGRVARVRRQLGIGTGRARRLADPASYGAITVTATYRYPGEREREIDLSSYLDAEFGSAIIDAYLDGATPDELAEIAAGHISGSEFYEREFGLEADYGFDIASIDGWG